MKQAEIKIYHITKHPSDYDLSNFCTHSCNPDYIKEIVFRFQLSSDYPQTYLVKLDQQRATKVVTINGVKVHVVLCSSADNPHYSLWTFPDKEENIAWYERIFNCMVDLADGRLKGLSGIDNVARMKSFNACKTGKSEKGDLIR